MLYKTVTSLAALAVLASAAPATQNAAGCKYISTTEAQRIRAGFERGEIFPEVLPAFTPKLSVNVAYGDNVVDLGNTIPLTQTTMAPKYSLGAEKDYDPATTKYTILMVDPDAPSPEPPLPILETILDDFVHHVLVDVQPTCVKNQSPKTVCFYLATTPLSVDPHRYIFIALRQPPNFQAPPEFSKIFGLKTGDFIRNNNLEIVGGSYFTQGATDIL